MTRAALIGATLIVATPALLFVGAILGWLSRDREDNVELVRMRKVAAEADAILAALQAESPKTVNPANIWRLSCPECGVVEMSSDVLAVPVTDAEFDMAREVLLLEHAIAHRVA